MALILVEFGVKSKKCNNGDDDDNFFRVEPLARQIPLKTFIVYIDNCNLSWNYISGQDKPNKT